MTVTEISQALGVSQAATSQHLALLRNSGILESRKERNFVRYKLADQRIGSACRMMNVVVIAVRLRESLRPAPAVGASAHQLLGTRNIPKVDSASTGGTARDAERVITVDRVGLG